MHGRDRVNSTASDKDSIRRGAQQPHDEAVPLIRAADLRTARLARKVADTCLQFHGGIGYMEETWTARYFRDTRLWSIGGGADEVMLRTLARLDGMGGTAG